MLECGIGEKALPCEAGPGGFGVIGELEKPTVLCPLVEVATAVTEFFTSKKSWVLSQLPSPMIGGW